MAESLAPKSQEETETLDESKEAKTKYDSSEDSSSSSDEENEYKDSSSLPNGGEGEEEEGYGEFDELIDFDELSPEEQELMEKELMEKGFDEVNVEEQELMEMEEDEVLEGEDAGGEGDLDAKELDSEDESKKKETESIVSSSSDEEKEETENDDNDSSESSDDEEASDSSDDEAASDSSDDEETSESSDDEEGTREKPLDMDEIIEAFESNDESLMFEEKKLLNEKDPFDFPKDPEGWREEDIRELWEDAPVEMTKPGWDPVWADEDDWEVILKEAEEGNDPPIAPFYLPYRRPYPVIPQNHPDISSPKSVIEELDRIEEFLKWVSYIFPDGSS